jgi:hypothetical protein
MHLDVVPDLICNDLPLMDGTLILVPLSWHMRPFHRMGEADHARHRAMGIEQMTLESRIYLFLRQEIICYGIKVGDGDPDHRALGLALGHRLCLLLKEGFRLLRRDLPIQ